MVNLLLERAHRDRDRLVESCEILCFRFYLRKWGKSVYILFVLFTLECCNLMNVSNVIKWISQWLPCLRNKHKFIVSHLGVELKRNTSKLDQVCDSAQSLSQSLSCLGNKHNIIVGSTFGHGTQKIFSKLDQVCVITQSMIIMLDLRSEHNFVVDTEFKRFVSKLDQVCGRALRGSIAYRIQRKYSNHLARKHHLSTPNNQ